MPRIVAPDDVPAHKQQWLWIRWFAYGVINLVRGAVGTGKSTVVGDVVARASSGRKMPGMESDEEADDDRRDRHAVVIVSLEEPVSKIKARLRALGADLNYVRFIEVSPGEEPFDIERHLNYVDEAWMQIADHEAKRNQSVAPEFATQIVGYVLVVDTILRAMPNRDNRSYSATNAALQPLIQLMNQRPNVLAIFLNHLDKQGRDGLGSVGLEALGRSTITCSPDAAAGDFHFIAKITRTAGGDIASMRYETRKTSDGSIVCDWNGEAPVRKSAEQRKAEQISAVRDDILAVLRPKPLRWTDLHAALKTADIVSSPIIQEARGQLNDEEVIGKRRIGSGTESFWVWFCHCPEHNAAVQRLRDEWTQSRSKRRSWRPEDEPDNGKDDEDDEDDDDGPDFRDPPNTPAPLPGGCVVQPLAT